jgi:hypothetical protein
MAVNPRRLADRCTLRFSHTSLGIFFALTVGGGCSHEQAPRPVIPTPGGATNRFVIHLQEGFHDCGEAVITVDGREVYRGTPETNPVLGFAAGVSAVAASPRPVVTLTIASKRISWSQRIDLSAGAAVGITLTTGGLVEVRQAPAFGYD